MLLHSKILRTTVQLENVESYVKSLGILKFFRAMQRRDELVTFRTSRCTTYFQSFFFWLKDENPFTESCETLYVSSTTYE